MMTKEHNSKEQENERIGEAIRAKEEKVAAGRAMLEDYADLYEDDPGV